MSAEPLDGVASATGARDVLVFALFDGHLRLMGGVGRGDGWAGSIEMPLKPDEDPQASRALATGLPVRVDDNTPQRVIGPYWSRHAALVPVGDDHLVVFGAEEGIRISAGELLRHAAAGVAACGDVPSEKLLADELEVVHAVRALMDYHPKRIADTARHVAAVATEALSCEVGAVLVKVDGRRIIGVAGPASCDCDDDKTVGEALVRLADRTRDGPLVEQELAPDAELAGVRVVSRVALRLGDRAGLGLLAVGHAATSPRGFTSLCQRVGRSIADAAEVLLSQAIARERLAEERDRLAVEARTDGLTGLNNRAAFEEALDREQARFDRRGRPVCLLAVDVNRLKNVNDRYGHAAGDELLSAAGDVLRGALRASDLAARIGGDEFAVLLPETELAGVRAMVRRLERLCETWTGSRPELRLSLSIGFSEATPGERLRDALRRADAAMYEARATADALR